MAMQFGKRLAVVGLLLAAGGCEVLKHVRITSDEHSPFAGESAPSGARAGGIRVQTHLPLSGEDGKQAE